MCLWIDQGVKDEIKNENGISHVCEHMAYKINSKNNKKSIVELFNEINNNGIRYNGATTKDFTSFYFDGTSKYLNLMLETLSVLIVNKSEAEVGVLESEKRIILQELSRYVNSTGQIAERLGQAIWGDISYGQLVIGKREIVESISSEQISKIYDERYIPESSILVVVGDVEYEEVLEYTEKFFGDWKDKIKPKIEYTVNDNLGIYSDNRFSGARSSVCIGFSSYHANDPQCYTVDLVREYLVSLNGSLYQEIEKDEV